MQMQMVPPVDSRCYFQVRSGTHQVRQDCFLQYQVFSWWWQWSSFVSLDFWPVFACLLDLALSAAGTFLPVLFGLCKILWLFLLNSTPPVQFPLKSCDTSRDRQSLRGFSSPHCFTYLERSCFRVYTLLLGSFLSSAFLIFLYSSQSYSWISHLAPLSLFQVSFLVFRIVCCPINFSTLVRNFPHEDAIIILSDLFQPECEPCSCSTCFDYFCQISSLCQHSYQHQRVAIELLSYLKLVMPAVFSL